MTSSRVNPLGVCLLLSCSYISGVRILAMWLLCWLRSGYSCSEVNFIFSWLCVFPKGMAAPCTADGRMEDGGWVGGGGGGRGGRGGWRTEGWKNQQHIHKHKHALLTASHLHLNPPEDNTTPQRWTRSPDLIYVDLSPWGTKWPPWICKRQSHDVRKLRHTCFHF